MTNNEEQLTARLAELAEAPAPEAVVDVERARTVGRKRLRRRRVAGAAGAAAVLVLAGLLGSGLRGGNDGAPLPAVTPTVRPGSLVSDVRFGWLPAWVDSGVDYSSADGERSARVGVVGAVHPSYRVMLTAPGSAPGAQYGSWPMEQKDAPEVNGRRAYWLTTQLFVADPPKRSYLLRWQAPDGRWAELAAEYLPEGAEDEVLRVAAGVTFGTWEVPAPVRVGGTGRSRFLGAVLNRPGQTASTAWDYYLTLDVDGERRVYQVRPVAEVPRASLPVHDDPVSGDPADCRTERGIRICLVAGGLAPEELVRGRAALTDIELVDGFA